VLEKLKRVLRGRKEGAAFRLPGQIDDGSRVLAMAGGDLSDLHFHMPILAGIRRTWPGASLDFLVPESFASLVIPSGLARQVLVYGENQLAAWKPSFRSLQRSLAATHYDVSFVLCSTPQPTLEALGLSSGAILRYGPSHGGSWPAVNLELRTRPTSTTYIAERWLELAPFLGLDAGKLRPGWPLPGDKRRQVAQVVHFNKPRPQELLVGIDPGPDKAGRALASQNLVFLVQQLKSWFDCRLLPLCGPGGQDRLRQFEAQLAAPVPPAFNRDTLLDTLLLLSQCDLFLAGNTDLFHLAVAAGVPSVGLFGSQVPTAWHPAGRSRCAVLTVASGKRIEAAALRAAIDGVLAGPPPAGGAEGATGIAGAPLPAPGA
jgi:ADP-heptose:LPS heptosyltransferase